MEKLEKLNKFNAAWSVITLVALVAAFCMDTALFIVCLCFELWEHWMIYIVGGMMAFATFAAIGYAVLRICEHIYDKKMECELAND